MLYWPRCWVLYVRNNLQLLSWSILKEIMKIQYTIYNLKITNTFFKHKPIHLTSWQSPVPYVNITGCKTNTPRGSLFRNQIDYILVRNNTNAKVFDSKSELQQIRIISLSSQKSWSNTNINQKLKAGRNVSTYIIW